VGEHFAELREKREKGDSQKKIPVPFFMIGWAEKSKRGQ